MGLHWEFALFPRGPSSRRMHEDFRDLGVSQKKGTSLGVPIIRIMLFGVYIGVPSFWETATSYLWAKLLPVVLRQSVDGAARSPVA